MFFRKFDMSCLRVTNCERRCPLWHLCNISIPRLMSDMKNLTAKTYFPPSSQAHFMIFIQTESLFQRSLYEQCNLCNQVQRWWLSVRMRAWIWWKTVRTYNTRYTICHIKFANLHICLVHVYVFCTIDIEIVFVVAKIYRTSPDNLIRADF